MAQTRTLAILAAVLWGIFVITSVVCWLLWRTAPLQPIVLR